MRVDSVGFKPLAHTWIEVISFFKVKGMTRSIIEMRITVWDTTGDLLRHPHRREYVITTSDYKAGSRNFAKICRNIMSDASSSLPTESMQWLRDLIGVKILPSLKQSFVAFLAVKEWLGEDQQLDPFHKLLISRCALQMTIWLKMPAA